MGKNKFCCTGPSKIFKFAYPFAIFFNPAVVLSKSWVGVEKDHKIEWLGKNLELLFPLKASIPDLIVVILKKKYSSGTVVHAVLSAEYPVLRGQRQA